MKGGHLVLHHRNKNKNKREARIQSIMSIGHVFPIDDDDDDIYDPFAEEYKKYRVEDIHRMMQKVRSEGHSSTSDALFYGSRNLIYLAYSPLAGPIITSLYGVGLLIGIVAPLDMSISDYMDDDFDRRAGDLNYLSRGYFGEKREIVSQAERTDHAIVSKCAQVSLFGGCLGNSLISRSWKKELPKQAYFTKAKAPFFLMGALGIVLTQYSATYKARRNEALLKEAEYVVSRLIE
jgi:hypothetical protein